MLRIILYFPLCFSGDEVNNGGGIAEKNIRYVYQNIQQYIEICLTSSACKLNNFERQLLINIKDNMHQEYKNEKQLQFLSEKGTPGFFILNKEVKIAKTGNKIGSNILINQDLLYSKNYLDIYEAITLPQALSIIIHELGHHHKMSMNNCDKLDILGNKMAIVLQQHITNTPLFPHSNKVSITVLNKKQKYTFPKIILYIYNQMIDISDQFINSISCPLLMIPAPSKDLPKLDIEGSRPLGATFHNTHWSLTSIKKSKSGEFNLLGNLFVYCRKDRNLLVNGQTYSARITFEIEEYYNKKEKKSIHRFKKNSLTIKQIYNPWFELIRS